MDGVVLKGESFCYLQFFELLLRPFFIGQCNESGSVEAVMLCITLWTDKMSSHMPLPTCFEISQAFSFTFLLYHLFFPRK